MVKLVYITLYVNNNDKSFRDQLESFGKVSSMALHGKTRADKMHVSVVDCIARSSLSRAKRKTPGKTM